MTLAGTCASSSNSSKGASEIPVVARAFGVRGGCAVSLPGISRCGFFLVLDTALVTSSPWHFLFALLEADEDSLCCLMETSFRMSTARFCPWSQDGKGF